MNNFFTLSKLCLLMTFVVGIGFMPLNAHSTTDAPREVQPETLVKILDDFSKRYEVFFSYDVHLLSKVKVEFEFRPDETVEDAIVRLMSKTMLKYDTFEDKYIVIYENSKKARRRAKKVMKKFKEINELEKGTSMEIKRKPNAFIDLIKTFTNLGSKEDIHVKGNVSDEDGEALIGVLIRISGKGTGTTTDINGNFEIDIIDEDDPILEVSYLGYETLRIKVDNRDFINIVLEIRSHELDEVVVTGFQTLNKGRSTGSFSRLDQSQLDDIFSDDLTDKLEGHLTGLNVNSDGSFEIRGQSTFLGIDNSLGSENSLFNPIITNSNIPFFKDQNKPLLVVDGFPIEADISTLNTNDIESVTVLKDAAAASIYGVRASNGVIVVTTKKPEKDKFSVTMSSHVGYNLKPDFSMFNLMSGADQVDYDAYIASTDGDIWRSSLYYVPEAANIILQKTDGQISEQQADQMLDELRNNDNAKQLEDKLFRNGLYQNYNLALRNGSEKMNTAFSIQHTNEQSVFVGNDNTNTLVNLKFDFKPLDWLNLDVGYTGAYSDISNNSRWDNLDGGLRTYDAIYNNSGDYAPMYSRNYGARTFSILVPNQNIISELESLGYLSWRNNVIEEQALSDISTKDFQNRFQTRLTFKPFNFLTFESAVELEINDRLSETFLDEKSAYVRSIINTYTQVDETTGQLIHNYPTSGGILYRYEDNETNIHVRNQILYDQLFSSKHRITALLGIEQKRRNSEVFYKPFFGYDKDTGLEPTLNLLDLTTSELTFNNRAGISAQIGSKFDRPRDLGYYSSFAYSYNDKYTASFTYRIDESNLFGVLPDLRRNKLWSVGTAWILSDETFFDSEVLDYIKFRATYGFTGNVDRNGSTSFIARIRNDFAFGLGTVLDPSQPANISYRPEKTKNINIGADLKAFKNRLSMSVDLYRHHHEDLITQTVVDATNGWTAAILNDGTMINKGIEISFKYPVIRRSKFNWDLNWAFTYNKNEVTETNLPESTYFEYPNRVSGRALSSVWSIPYEGLDENGAAIVRNTSSGELISASLFEGPTVEDNEIWIHSGQYKPKYWGGLQNRFSYKNLSLRFNLIFEGGHKYTLPLRDWYSVRESPGKFAADHWKKPGDEKITDIPSPSIGSDYELFYSPDLFSFAQSRVQDATWIRVRNVGLEYRLPTRWLHNKGIKTIEISAQIENPLLWTKSSFNYDPRYISPVSPGIPAANSEQSGFAQKSVLFGVKLIY